MVPTTCDILGHTRSRVDRASILPCDTSVIRMSCPQRARQRVITSSRAESSAPCPAIFPDGATLMSPRSRRWEAIERSWASAAFLPRSADQAAADDGHGDRDQPRIEMATVITRYLGTVRT